MLSYESSTQVPPLVGPAPLEPLLNLAPLEETTVAELFSPSLSGLLFDSSFCREIEQIRRELSGYDLQQKLAILKEAWAQEVVSTSGLHSISDDDGDDPADSNGPAVDVGYGGSPHGRKRLKLS